MVKTSTVSWCALKLVFIACVLFAAPISSYGQGFDYQFNGDGVLPSAQLATYGGPLPETAVFSVSGGILYQSTLNAGNDVEAYYEIQQIFDHTLPAVLEWRARFVACAQACQASAAVSLLTSTHQWLVNLDNQGVTVAATANNSYVFQLAVPMDTSDTMHTYRLEIPPNSSAYSLFVDGELKYTGIAASITATPGAWWGDGTPTGGNAAVEWDYITLRNGTAFSICPLYDQDKAKKAGSTIPIKIQLCDAVGANLSSAAITVKALTLVKMSDNASSNVEDAGNSNPDDNFRFSNDHYIFNLKTTGLEMGTYRLTLKAGDDPTTHSISFQIR